MNEWKNRLMEILNLKEHNILWTDIGSKILKAIYADNREVYSDYKIFNGLNNMYPCNWDVCTNEFITANYDNYKNIIRPYQHLIILVNTVYKALENYSINEIMNTKIPIQYFLHNSIKNTNQTEINPAIQPHIQINNITNNTLIFENIYKNQIWNKNNKYVPLSGPGSSVKKTVNCVKTLTDIIYDNNCKNHGKYTWLKMRYRETKHRALHAPFSSGIYSNDLCR